MFADETGMQELKQERNYIMRKNSIKNTRINSEVGQQLSMIIRELKDPRIAPMTSITEAVVTADLKYCTAYVSVLGGEDAVKETLEGLNAAKGFIRRELAETVNLRITPEIKFVHDSSLEYGMKMSKLIDEVISKDNEQHTDTED